MQSQLIAQFYCAIEGDVRRFMHEETLDQRDRAILRELMRDGRLTNTELAERVNLSPSACLRRVRAMEESGLIAGYVMLLDTARADYRDAADFERIHTRILTQLPGVMRVQSALTLRTVKRTTALPI